MMNFRQKELAYEYFEKVKAVYPEIELVNITESPEDPNDHWINVYMPYDDEKEFELMEFAADIGSDILLEYGYLFLFMPEKKRKHKLAA